MNHKYTQAYEGEQRDAEFISASPGFYFFHVLPVDTETSSGWCSYLAFTLLNRITLCTSVRRKER